MLKMIHIQANDQLVIRERDYRPTRTLDRKLLEKDNNIAMGLL